MIHLARLSRTLFWLAMLLAYTLAIVPGNPGIVSNDKGNHALAFSALGLLARIGWPGTAGWKQAVALTAFGGFIELSQAMPFIGRDASWADLAADAIFTVAGIALGRVGLALIAARPHASGDDRP